MYVQNKRRKIMKKVLAILIVVLMVTSIGVVFSSAAASNIAKDKPYTVTGIYKDGNGNIPYPDTDGKELTDGKSGTTAADIGYPNDTFPHWVGLNWKGINSPCKDEKWTDETVATNEIIVDLGKKESGLAKFTIYTEDLISVGIGKAKSFEVLVSNNNTDFKSAGKSDAAILVAETDDKVSGLYKFELSLSAAVSGRYVKFNVTHGGAWAFVSEVEVYQDPDVPSAPETSDTSSVSLPLVSNIISEWKLSTEVNGELAKLKLDNGSIVVYGSTAAWPYAYFNIANPVSVSTAEYELVYDFTVTGGKTNIILFCEGSTVDDNNNYISNLTHNIAADGSAQRPSGDDLLEGTYTGRIKLSDLDLSNVAVKEDGKLTISSVKVYTVGGAEVKINKFALEKIATSSDVSSQVSETSSSSVVTDQSEVKTGDAGIYMFVLFAVLSITVATFVSVKKRTSK